MSSAGIVTPTLSLRRGGWAGGVVTAPPLGSPSVHPSVAGWAVQYIQPLEQWFNELLGDPMHVSAVADSWGKAERMLTAAVADLEAVSRQLDTLEGRTVRTVQLRHEDLRASGRSAADWSGSVAAAARLASSVVAGVLHFLSDFLGRLARLIGALFGFSLSPFDKVAELSKLTSAAIEFAYAGRQLINNMFDAFTDLVGLLRDLDPVFAETVTKLREVLARMLPIGAGALGAQLGSGVGFALGGPLGSSAGGALGGALGASLGAARSDMLMGSGEITRYDERKKSQAAAKIADALSDDRRRAFQSGRLDSLSDLVQANSLTDALGGGESTAIDVKLVRGSNGNVHWVVSLPSTQEWFDTRGSGAMNDRNTNLSLMFMDDPNLKSQYERAVMRAMREAGMAPGDPVVYTGFSQGGIMAAKLAANTSSPYNVIGVVTNGSPVDSFAVPAHIPVVAFQHENDPVAALDGNVTGNTPPNVHRVILPAPGGVLDLRASHNNNNYATSIDLHAQSLSEQYGWMGGEIIDHQVFEGVQR